jgi:hypothetical protein
VSPSLLEDKKFAAHALNGVHYGARFEEQEVCHGDAANIRGCKGVCFEKRTNLRRFLARRPVLALLGVILVLGAVKDLLIMCGYDSKWCRLKLRWFYRR